MIAGNQSSTQSTTNTTQPYAAAQPWINSNIASGQSLQSQYQAQPLSLGQIGAYANSQGLTDGFRSQANSLVNQMNNMATFDRNNPTAKATQFNFSDAPANTANTFNTVLSSLPQASQGLLANQAISAATGVQGSGSGSSYKTAGESWYSQTTPEERAAFFAANPTLAALSSFGINTWQKLNPYGMAAMQNPAQTAGYLSETTGAAPAAGSYYNGSYGHYGSNYGIDAYSMGPSQTNTADTSSWGTGTSND